MSHKIKSCGPVLPGGHNGLNVSWGVPEMFMMQTSVPTMAVAASSRTISNKAHWVVLRALWKNTGRGKGKVSQEAS